MPANWNVRGPIAGMARAYRWFILGQSEQIDDNYYTRASTKHPLCPAWEEKGERLTETL